MKRDKPSRNGACAFIRSHLISVAEGGLSGAALSRVKDHLASCTKCVSLVQRFSEAWENPALLPDTRPSPAFLPGLIERIEAGEKSQPGRRSVLAIAWRALKPAAIAVVLLGGIFAGHEMGQRGETVSPPPAPFSGQWLDSFENIPPGSIADFYVKRQNPMKEDLE